MSNVRVLNQVSSRPEILTGDYISRLEADNYIFYRESTADDMRDALATGSQVNYVAMRPDGITEHELLKSLYLRKRDLDKRKFMDHVQNIRSKAQGPFFDEFLQSVLAILRPEYKQLVKGCSNFKAFADVLSVLRVDKRNTIVSACKDFCDKYQVASGFWEQSSSVDGMNTNRNNVSHCGVADSAAAIIQASQKPADYLEAGMSWSMLEALANYSIQNADALDAATVKDRQRLLRDSRCALVQRQQS